MTTYAPEHKGGADFITDFCGMEATRDFSIEHKIKELEDVEDLFVCPYYCLQQFYTIQDVAQHNTVIDCWYVLYGTVYDFNRVH